MRLSKTMLTVLRKLKDSGPDSAYGMGCSIATLASLERRKLVRVETTLGSIAFPQNALAYITDAGKTAAFEL